MGEDGVVLLSGKNGQSAHWSLLDSVSLDDLRNVFHSGYSTQVVFYRWSDKVAATVERLLLVASEVYDFPFSIEPLLVSLQELALNAVKANMKKVALLDGEDAGYRKFYEDVHRGARHLASLTRRRHYWAAIVIHPDKQKMRIDVINASPLLLDEENRIRVRMELASAFCSLDQFHAAAGDAREGAGLGLYLVQLGLKELGIARRQLRIRSDHTGHTVARVSLGWSI